MGNPKVSVIITTYNRADYLYFAIKSVLDQTFNDFELIIIDDGSTDNTSELIKKYNDERIKYHFQSNQGQNPSRNEGMRLSTGEYIAHLDSDDIWQETKLQKQVYILNKYKDIGVVYCGTELIDKNNITAGKRPIAKNDGFILKKLLFSNFLYNGSNALFRRECLNKAGNFDESFWRMTDWEFYLRLAIYYKFQSIPEYLLKYRVHEDTMSYDFNGYEENGLNIINKICSHSDLSSELKSLKPKAVACRHRYMARRYFDENVRTKAYYYLTKTIKTDISMTLDPETIKLFMLVFMPKNIIKSLKIIKENLRNEILKLDKKINN